MPSWFSLLVLVSGVAILFASLLYLRAYLQFRDATKDLFQWREDSLEERMEVRALEDELTEAVRKGLLDKETALEIAKGALKDKRLDAASEERLLGRLIHLGSG
jgi:hypothetical protein